MNFLITPWLWIGGCRLQIGLHNYTGCNWEGHLLKGAKDLARPPTLSDVLHSALEEAKTNQNSSNDEEQKEEDDQSSDSNKRGAKCKVDPEELSVEIRKSSKEFRKVDRVKNVRYLS
ncbi:hypothetical protein Tco_1198078 [Tanacetum coccineum]